MIGAISYLIFVAVRSTSEYYLTVSEVNSRKAELGGQMLRVAGRVEAGTISWNATTLTLGFAMTQPPADPNQPQLTKVSTPADPPPSFRVIAVGEPKPDMFGPGRDVIVEGRLDRNNVIEARQVLTSCPSKYVPKQPKS